MARKIPITVMVVPNTAHFLAELDLAWFAHKKLYGGKATELFFAVVIKRNAANEPKNEKFLRSIPHKIVESYFDIEPLLAEVNEPTLNFTYGICQVLSDFDDDDILEVIDCDMFHLGKISEYEVEDNEVIVDDIYESWHLESKGSFRHIIKPYCKNRISIYNGGFVPIIAKVSTFKRIMEDWINIHYSMRNTIDDTNLRWWSIMYAFNAACDNNGVHMYSQNITYIPPINDILNKRICHYSVDPIINKLRDFDIQKFPNNIYYNTIAEWHNERHKTI